MEYDISIEELNLKISELESRIELLEIREQKKTGVILSGSNESAKTFHQIKKRELEKSRGGE